MKDLVIEQIEALPEEKGNFIQYCHSIPYNGNSYTARPHRPTKKVLGSRMTIRIEERAPNHYLVTTAVCSKDDTFTREKGRQETDLKANIAVKCHTSSKHIRKANGVSQGNLSFNTVLEDGSPYSIDLYIDQSEHYFNGKTTNLGCTMFFRSPIDKKKQIDAILDLYSNMIFGEFFEY